MQARLISFLLAGFALSVSLSPAPAKACSINSAMVAGLHGKIWVETYKEARQREARSAKIAIKKNGAAARLALAGGSVDVSGELARLLIPNVRSEDDGTRSSCGRMDGQEYASGDDADILDRDFKKAVSGDPHARQFLVDHENRPRKAYTAYYFGYPASACNAEFRGRFKDFLQSRYSAEALGQIWLFLKPRNRVFRPEVMFPMREFYDRTRKPPTTWSFSIGEIARQQVATWEAKTPEGQALHETLTAFWAEQGSQLEDSWAICPEVMNAWKPAQDPDFLREVLRRAPKARS